MGLGKITISFFKWVTTHGMQLASTAKNQCLRVFWTLLFLACAVLCTVHVKSIFDAYFRYGKLTAVQV